MAHPAEYFVRYTLAQAWGTEQAETTMVSLNGMLLDFGLLQLKERDYDRIKLTFTPPDGFRFHNHKHGETKKFMEEEKIFTLWQPTEEDRRVLSELVNGQMLVKHTLHLLLMGSIPHKIIAEKVSSKFRLSPAITERMVSTYHHYFWNVPNASVEQWDTLLEGKRYRDAFLAALMCGEQQALYRAGFNPRVDGNRAMKEAYRQAYFRIEALRFQPDSKFATNAYVQLAFRLMGIHEVLYAQGSGLEERLKEFRQIMMKHKDPDIKAADTIIDKLKGGSYSEDGSESDNELILPAKETNDE